ncbi:unknown [Crocosphaera subtropica ATCC 51142]|uniref:Telomere resolvase ResT/TelK catalytic domain-containing protein n=1 Tax=Crocosphaera subtropica (strain ATCC 51142 / BH68) TaxID=43989 RepID=B1X1X9_CROS5|nr:protelomerase family protein [Crocosphaera subtropica]ACB54140.1 unknown [Crocosphaera subtropica ATCC 51142]
MNKNPLEEAKTLWLRTFLEEHLPLVENLTSDTPNWEAIASDFAEQLNQTLCDRQLITPNQQKNPRAQVANALRCLNPNHPAISYPYTLLSPDTYTQLNLEQNKKTDQRQTKFFFGADAIALVDKATSLLHRDDPNEVAAGLAVLIGRRISEILISEFQPCTDYSVWFSEPVKKSGNIPPFEIPTLIEADTVLSAIARLRNAWNINDIKANATSDRQLKQMINKRYEGVPKAVRRHFSDLIPGREVDNDSGEKLYTHVFRSVYAEIATYFYKPSTVPDHRFKAEIQGHFTLTAQGKVRSYTSRPHYDDYLIGDRTPNQEGIKLSLPNISILSVFDDKINETIKDHKGGEQVTKTENAESIDIKGMIEVLQEQYRIATLANEDKYKAIIAGKDALLEEKDVHLAFLEDELKAVRQSPNHQQTSQNNQGLHDEIDRLNGIIESLEQERDEALEKLSQLQNILNPGSSSPQPVQSSNSKTSQSDKQNVQTDKDEGLRAVVRRKEMPDKVDIIDKAIAAIQRYNDEPSRTEQEKWYMSNPAVSELIRDSGYTVSSQVLQARLREKGDELTKHHEKHGLGSRHNRKHDQPISQFIQI